MHTDPQLWARLDAFSLDDPDASFAFTDRLARENGWRDAFAHRVVGEYRRFVYLSQVTDRIVTPSDEVDQAWHLHLTYTRHYWDALCGGVLGRALHHGPTRGGPAEHAKYLACYEATKALYRREFGEEPPADIWPDAETRFAEAPAFRRVNTAHAWVIHRPRWLDRVAAHGRAIASLAAAALGLSLVGGSLALADTDARDEETAVIIAIGIVIFVAAVVSATRRSGSRRPHRGGRSKGGSGCGGCGHAGSDGGDGGSGCGSSGCGGGGCGGGD
ncbi:MAG: hypothetical protein R3F55_24865 [Alphaproteobacteria bacterium]